MYSLTYKCCFLRQKHIETRANAFSTFYRNRATMQSNNCRNIAQTQAMPLRIMHVFRRYAEKFIENFILKCFCNAFAIIRDLKIDPLSILVILYIWIYVYFNFFTAIL